MKKTIVILAALMMTAAAYAQGAVNFSTFISGAVEYPIRLPDGTGPGGPGNNAMTQLFKVESNGSLTALTPASPFRQSTSALRTIYNDGATVTVPGADGSAAVTFRIRAWVGSDYDSAVIKGEGANFTLTPSLAPNPPANLPFAVGTTGFTMVPEPSTMALGILGLAALFIRRRK